MGLSKMKLITEICLENVDVGRLFWYRCESRVDTKLFSHYLRGAKVINYIRQSSSKRKGGGEFFLLCFLCLELPASLAVIRARFHDADSYLASVLRENDAKKCMPNCQIRQIWLNEILINQFSSTFSLSIWWELNFTREINWIVNSSTIHIFSHLLVLSWKMKNLFNFHIFCHFSFIHFWLFFYIHTKKNV